MEAEPIDMVLFCPACGLQHVDGPTEAWMNPPHRSHLCAGCGHIWRPADVPTNGVAAILTRGANDSAQAAGSALEWRPIETAPRDFTPIIGWCSGGVRQWYRWVDDRHSGRGWFNSEQQRVTEPAPTHWHPLPARPAGEA